MSNATVDAVPHHHNNGLRTLGIIPTCGQEFWLRIVFELDLVQCLGQYEHQRLPIRGHERRGDSMQERHVWIG